MELYDEIKNELADAINKYNSFGYTINVDSNKEISKLTDVIDAVKKFMSEKSENSATIKVLRQTIGLNDDKTIDIHFEFKKVDEDGNELSLFSKGDYFCFEAPAPNKDVRKIVLKPKIKHGFTFVTFEDDNGNRRELMALSIRKATKEEIEANTRLD